MRERGIEVELTDDARTLLGNLGYDPTYGARPLKRVIQRQLVDKLALKILEGEFREGDAGAGRRRPTASWPSRRLAIATPDARSPEPLGSDDRPCVV